MVPQGGIGDIILNSALLKQGRASQLADCACGSCRVNSTSTPLLPLFPLLLLLLQLARGCRLLCPLPDSASCPHCWGRVAQLEPGSPHGHGSWGPVARVCSEAGQAIRTSSRKAVNFIWFVCYPSILSEPAEHFFIQISPWQLESCFYSQGILMVQLQGLIVRQTKGLHVVNLTDVCELCYRT